MVIAQGWTVSDLICTYLTHSIVQKPLKMKIFVCVFSFLFFYFQEQTLSSNKMQINSLQNTSIPELLAIY